MEWVTCVFCCWYKSCICSVLDSIEVLNWKNMLLQIFEDRWTMFYLSIPYLYPYIHSPHPPAAVAMRGGDSEGWRDFVFAIWMVASGAYSWFDVGAPWIKMEGMFLFKEISETYWGSSKEVFCLSSATRLPSFWENWMFEDVVSKNMGVLFSRVCWWHALRFAPTCTAYCILYVERFPKVWPSLTM